MDAFLTHEKVIKDYRSYLSSFLSIQDERIKLEVEEAFNDDGFLPEPLVQFNPAFEKGKTLTSLVDEGKIHPDLPKVFGTYSLFKHQVEALEAGIADKGFIVTSGTGSGKSLTFLATIFNDIFKQGKAKKKGIKAILVYPMNALINSQEEEIKKYAENFGPDFPIIAKKYTGQEGGDLRDLMKQDQPDIILTNYMMLELIMTRQSESWMRDSIRDNLKFLVFDELHTYRGRQGSDVSMLIRRIKGIAKNPIICIGTSATMMSGGSPEQKKTAVAQVGELIFGQHYDTKSIIGEFLEPCTSGINPNAIELRKSIEKGISKEGDEDEFFNHPLSNWLELNIALRINEGHLERNKPLKITEIAEQLRVATELPIEKTRTAIVELLKWTETLNNNRRSASKRTFLPFRFHQFISQTSIVAVTLESRELREITIKPGRYIKVDNQEQLLYPVLFSRISGYDFICVEKDVVNHQLKPRNPDDAIDSLTQKDAKGENLSEEHFKQGYIVLDEGEEFWNESFEAYVPESWYARNGSSLQSYYDWQMPKRIYFNSKGNYSSDPIYPLTGFFISAKLRIDPTAGIIYEDVKTGENTKLMRIGNEGRSTATTIISYSVVDSLFNQNEKYADQKLLSFTDNRQDASLQAGHFNDFLSTVRLRSALYHALVNNPSGLTVHTIEERLFEILDLDESKYARKPSEDKDFPDIDNVRALKHYLLLRIFQDLKRGWRYTLPNLEQTALLRIEYNRLKHLASLDEKFQSLDLFKSMPALEREETLIQVLNYFRTNFSLEHRILIDDRGEIETLLKNKLDEKKLWSLDHNEHIDAPKYLCTANPGRTQRGIYTGSIGPQSGLGKFLKRKYQELELPTPKRDELRELIDDLCLLLSKTNFLSRKEGIKGDKSGPEGVIGYLLRTDCIVWHQGNGINVGIDETRINNFRDFEIKPNSFFKELYMRDFTRYNKEFEGREHTGQLDSEDRIDREEKFKSGDISALFCSPTMELGIDIANLNIVHMRNVPPNPSNYAQRSGRAGRSGQTALVFTYCSALSPHDQNYFNASDTMVSGAVVPPRIDLTNEELLRTHFHAYLLMELELNALNSSVSALLDLENIKSLKVQQTLIDQIENNLKMHGTKWAENFRQYILKLLPDLKEVWWFKGNWFDVAIHSFSEKFERSFDRWRNLYWSAKKMIDASRMIMDDPTIKHSSEEFREAKRQHNVGLLQIKLLKNDEKLSFGNQSEFYVFRYLASEGFIPGYNFTRLPVRTFVGFKHEDKGSYISRSRFIALKEFGPNNLIYHKGNKHRITRMMMTDADAMQRKMKISTDTGYAFLDDEAVIANNDPITNAELKGSNFEYRTKLIEIGESEAIPQMRISCEEEERVSTGYIIDYYFNYSSGIEHTKKSVIQKGGQSLLNLIYGPATKLIALNRQWRKSTTDGFSIDQRTGRWLRIKDLEDETIRENEQKVMIFAQDTADTLYIQPLDNLKISPDQIISLSYALKRGIEVLFQVEESEIGISIIGKKENPNVMIYETAQGSLGILSQLVAEPLKLRELFKVAYECMHFDPITKDDTPLGKTLPKASYQDLLSYYNQRQHDILDRYSIKETLEYLMDCDVSGTQGNNDREAQYAMLLNGYDKNSGTELKLLKYLYQNGFSLPDKAQVNIKEYYVSADFIYSTSSGSVIVFCDGAVHDKHAIMEDDKHKRDLLYSKGYDIIEWHYSEPLDDLVKRRKDVFRKVC